MSQILLADDEVYAIPNGRINLPFTVEVGGTTYHIPREGMAVKAYHADYLDELKVTVWCFKKREHIEVKAVSIKI